MTPSVPSPIVPSTDSPAAPGPAGGSSPSLLARQLGYAGLLPFLGAATASWVGGPELQPIAAMVLLTYAAVIVSFLGGIHWGWAMAHPGQGSSTALAWGVTPSLVAWTALLMPSSTGGLWLSAAALALCWAVDRPLYRQRGLAAWLPLRTQLSTVALLCCAAGASVRA